MVKKQNQESALSISNQIDSAKQNIEMYKKKIAFLTEQLKTVNSAPLQVTHVKTVKKRKTTTKTKSKSNSWGLPSSASLATAYGVAKNTGIIQKLQDAFSPQQPVYQQPVYQQPQPQVVQQSSIW